MTAAAQGTYDRPGLQRWLPYCRLNPGRHKLHLLCFAHAGGSALVFHKWQAKLPGTVQVCAVQLPGRERRLNEPFIKRMPELIDELSRALLPYLDRPVALFGHSLGARVAFEFARRIKARAEERKVVHLFVSGNPAPHLPLIDDPIHTLPDQQFFQKVCELGGTPEELLSDAEFMQLLLPRLRADFELYETCTFAPQEVLECPITAWTGQADTQVPASSIEAWKQHTRGRFRSQVLQGAHFALYEREDEVLPQITDELAMFL